MFLRLFLAAFLLASPWSVAARQDETPPAIEEAPAHPEASPYAEIPEIAAIAHFEGVRAAAILQGKRLVAVFGANWCHDSRALAGWLETPRFRALTDKHFIVVYIDAGRPQDSAGRNMALAARLGVSDIEGTPNLLVLDPANGKLLNTPESAKGWRDAASRSADAIFDELASYAPGAG